MEGLQPKQQPALSSVLEKVFSSKHYQAKEILGEIYFTTTEPKGE
ncbi:hypothetical protein [Sporosarcina sp. P34]|nr:hypothetical protein [Sporosarcina sp. P34]